MYNSFSFFLFGDSGGRASSMPGKCSATTSSSHPEAIKNVEALSFRMYKNRWWVKLGLWATYFTASTTNIPIKRFLLKIYCLYWYWSNSEISLARIVFQLIYIYVSLTTQHVTIRAIELSQKRKDAENYSEPKAAVIHPDTYCFQILPVLSEWSSSNTVTIASSESQELEVKELKLIFLISTYRHFSLLGRDDLQGFKHLPVDNL